MVSAAAKRPLGPDPTHYPVDEDVGESILHKLIIELLRPLVERWLAARGTPGFVGADQFIYWVQYAPTRCVAPDVYVLPGVPVDAEVKAWKVWETGVVPSFVLEVASDDFRKDYQETPVRYADLGVRELVVFDPLAASSPERVRWQVFRHVPPEGLSVVERSDGDRVRSEELGCWLRAVGSGAELRVRLATGKNGDELVPTDAEAERAAKDAERAAKDAERAAKDAAQAEVARLRADIERLRRGD
ncbi:MAG: Uma2 family endonuclease [Polyangiaceae bacterium]